MKLILSTLTSPQSVCITSNTASGALVVSKRITINGGANAIDRRTLNTPEGVVTELTDEDYDALIQTDFYKRMESRGYLRKVSTKSAGENTKRAGMKEKDKSAQKVKSDFAEGAPA